MRAQPGSHLPVRPRHILAYLEKAELREENPHLRADIRQAWIVVSLASRGESEPFVQSSYRMYGVHPSKLWPAIMATRRAKLGREFPLWFDQAGNLKPDAPNKPSAPVTPHPDKRVPARLAAVLKWRKAS